MLLHPDLCTVAILSDTHTELGTIIKNGMLPNDVDVYIFPGDFTYQGRDQELLLFRKQIQTHFLNMGRTVIAIAGNHELGIEDDYEHAMSILQPAPDDGFYWLHDTTVEIEGFKFFGSPYTPWFHDWAFNIREESEMQKHWDLIEEGTHCVITHGPPYRVLDLTKGSKQNVGSRSLRDTIERVKPQLHCFGHIHEEYGVKKIGDTTFINGSVCTLSYKPTNPIQIFTLRKY